LKFVGLAPPAVTVLTAIWFQVLMTAALAAGTGGAAPTGATESMRRVSSAGATRQPDRRVKVDADDT
jgi:hypothetical protein